MATYVVKSWKVQKLVTPESPYLVSISGRASGIIDWILGVLKISPEIDMKVSEDKISFHQGSLGGTHQHITPLEKLCSTHYGFKKPWKESLAIGIAAAVLLRFILGALMGNTAGLVGFILGLNVGVLYYFLNLTLTVGFTTDAGEKFGIQFKPSIIENQSVDEEAASQVCSLIQQAADRARAGSATQGK